MTRSGRVEEDVPVESAGSGATTARTGEATLGGGFNYSSKIGLNKVSQSFFVGGTYGVGKGGFGTSLELIVPGGIAKVANAPCEEVGLRKVMVLAGGTVNEVNMTGEKEQGIWQESLV
ncbi:hypothetical protein Tco_0970414 [Tanacetum coccineum]